MELEKTPTVELVKTLTKLDNEIEYKILQYQSVYEELIRRFPILKEEIKPKEYKKSNL